MLPVNFEYAIDIVKAYEEEGKWVVEGYAATTDFDMQQDIITEEAIRASARDLIENSTVLHNHNPDEAIGKVLESRARKGGLFLKILVSKTVADIWQKIKEGVLNKFSVRGKVLDARKQWVPELKRFARLILKMRLVEVSLVAVPANPKARAIRWYVEKALDEFEKAGGQVPPAVPLVPRTLGSEGSLSNPLGETTEGGSEMGEQTVEILQASGDEAKGFPPPEELEKAWKEHAEKAGLEGKGQEEVDAAWVEFCKQQGYPSPYPYPYPKPTPQRGARMRQTMELVDKLLKEEKDDDRKKLLVQIREIARGAGYAYPYPAAKKQEPAPEPSGQGGTAEPPAPAAPEMKGDPGIEKAGRKISSARLARLKKLLKELEGLIAEVDSAAAQEKKADGSVVPSEKVALIEGTVGKIAKALGITEGKDDQVPDLAKAVEDLKKRLDDLEGTPAERTSLEGQEELPGEKKEGKTLWKGLL